MGGVSSQKGEGTELSAYLLACTRRDDYGMGAAPLSKRS